MRHKRNTSTVNGGKKKHVSASWSEVPWMIWMCRKMAQMIITCSNWQHSTNALLLERCMFQVVSFIGFMLHVPSAQLTTHLEKSTIDSFGYWQGTFLNSYRQGGLWPRNRNNMEQQNVQGVQNRQCAVIYSCHPPPAMTLFDGFTCQQNIRSCF